VIWIGANKYPITTQEEPAYVEELGSQIDKQVKHLMDNRMSLSEALVLVSLNYLDMYQKSEEGADHLRSQISEYLEEAAKARSEAAEARREIARLEARLQNKGIAK
jgi:cell division protein ZapA